MNFINPGFLFALFALLIPVIIHFFNFRKFKKVYFSNVQFLKSIQEQNSSRNKLKNLLILLTRMLALAFLIFAFARPYTQNDALATPNTSKAVHIYIDNSYSMESVNKEGSLLDNARIAAINIAKGFDQNTRFKLITNDFEGKNQRLLSFDEFRDAVGQVKISAASKNLQQILNRKQGTFSAFHEPIYIISDFQENFVGIDKISADSTSLISLIQLKANSIPNVAVDSVWFLSPIHRPGGTEKLVVRLKNFGDKPATEIPVKVLINGQQKALSTLTVPAKSSQLDTLQFSGLKAGWQRGEVEIKDYPLNFDDKLKFTFRVQNEMDVLSISATGSNKYLNALFRSDTFFNLTEMVESNINYSVLDQFSTVVLSGLENPSSGLAQQLRSFINNGGNLMLFPNLKVPFSTSNNFLNVLGLPTIKDVTSDTLKISKIALENPFFSDLFESVPKNLDLPTIYNFLHYNAAANGQEDLLQLPANRPWLSKYTIGKGQIFLGSSGLERSESNFPEHPLFVPLMYKMALSGGKFFKMNYTVGKDALLEVMPVVLGAKQDLMIEADNIQVIPEYSNNNGTAALYVADQIRTPGFYSLKHADSLIQIYAFNQHGDESNMLFSNKKDIEAKMGDLPFTFVDASRQAVTIKTEHQGAEWWKECLAIALFFLFIEILIIKYFNKLQPKQSNEYTA